LYNICRTTPPEKEDRREDYSELRYVTVGKLDGRMVILVWTPRGEARRIISMRKANEREPPFPAVIPHRHSSISLRCIMASPAPHRHSSIALRCIMASPAPHRLSSISLRCIMASPAPHRHSSISLRCIEATIGLSNDQRPAGCG
jgi:hypothetical protein